MNSKKQILTALQDILDRWQELIASLSEEQITDPSLPSNWSVKDVVAHMYAWQQASVARVTAALNGKEPDYPEWWVMMGLDPEEHLDQTNALIYQINRDKPWSGVYAGWKAQFLHYLELLKQIPEKDLFEPGRYAWMGTYALSASSMGSLEHHEEHLETLLAWLKEHGNMKTSG